MQGATWSGIQRLEACQYRTTIGTRKGQQTPTTPNFIDGLKPPNKLGERYSPPFFSQNIRVVLISSYCGIPEQDAVLVGGLLGHWAPLNTTAWIPNELTHPSMKPYS
ncbi:hypothetical protein I7I51_00867 [Histoplasma capsulatum]|uniref:Uncharacterized protein n=1 Tax=Ajellomyces capsulatus TaxID=5037 RepID=A0A8A1MI69_AJECA|nr:hypothetical protein I7I51_00867 [Histoplasma capsulatum]